MPCLAAGLPGGAGAAAGVAAEERGDGEQAPAVPTGGADGAEPAGEEGAGGRGAGAAGATVRGPDGRTRTHARIHTHGHTRKHVRTHV